MNRTMKQMSKQHRQPMTFRSFPHPIKSAIGIGFFLIVTACAGLPKPETPSQRLFVLQSHYSILAEAAATYHESPHADPQIVRRIQVLDRSIYNGLKQARELLDAGNGSTTLETQLIVLDKLIQEFRIELTPTERQAP